ncbi:FAD-dependent monooxygenase [Thauera linaloolentis]|uniref:UbiH/UbiF/VisC/COQ6 family ubiquinone biosynthesis hydroxylase n=1 Tax=Thauera linaloolentis (strain DSM 12138 / JCM 21573 / CCUG 41526 / CIP 105981 / IAM 15112 / NBRC 102519 / 47Lol) TaxID=1123367 RepID=N6Y7Y6_THAL4|nr:FAD-dependent monooxygenase [Thauera linaloolentis]ENO90366.1 UbiH/UbiF/VisC/COQ6 family ubiquinone biosynthesis hydroxylase [Thauera linaloolentis 47Lol = DSM 12138]MCM8564059.1 FAD-dependent oxidoreductase [Thauera linaloolentis]
MADIPSDTTHDLLIVGAGPVGLALALALKDAGLDIVLADARPREAVSSDPRDLALAHGSRLTLQGLGVWDALAATAIEHIHVSQQGGLGRTLIDAAEHGLPALGYVVSAGELAAALRAAVDAAGIPVLDETEVLNLAPGSDDIIASLATPGRPAATLRARLAACAEGGLRTDDPDVAERNYHQHALIAQLAVAGGHRGTAFERFTREGPLALLPKGEGYALVHVARPDTADALLALDDEAYLTRLQAHIGNRVQLSGVGKRLRYPLLLRYRESAVGARTVWLGNAAQTLHPVAGQGFNLALRDVWALADTLLRHCDASARATPPPSPRDPGTPAVLAAYARSRSLDRLGTIRFTDTLVRVFSNDFGPLRHARGATLFALDVFPPLRNFIARRMMFGARAWP